MTLFTAACSVCSLKCKPSCAGPKDSEADLLKANRLFALQGKLLFEKLSYRGEVSLCKDYPIMCLKKLDT